MDNYELNIQYTNETTLVPGKGYLLAIDKEQFLQNRGVLNNGTMTIDVTAKAPEWTGLSGYNLLGNPYQSYLDFDAFVDDPSNGNLWDESDEYSQTYALYDPSKRGYVQYVKGASQGGNTASRYINMHQGFFIRVSKAGTVTFNNSMRTNTEGEGFREEQPRYPLVNLMLIDKEGSQDFSVLELGRSDNGGGEKLRVGSALGRISLRHDNQDFAILFRDMDDGAQPLWFDAEEDGVFTLGWTTANAEFTELTLVDNITGVRTDMVSHDSYTFEGRMADYKSRFKVVIGKFTEIEDNEGDATIQSNFAFFDGCDWIVNGKGRLDVIDATGRTLCNTLLKDEQNRIQLDGVAQGVYVLRIVNGKEVKTQKIVVK